MWAHLGSWDAANGDDCLGTPQWSMGGCCAESRHYDHRRQRQVIALASAASLRLSVSSSSAERRKRRGRSQMIPRKTIRETIVLGHRDDQKLKASPAEWPTMLRVTSNRDVVT